MAVETLNLGESHAKETKKSILVKPESSSNFDKLCDEFASFHSNSLNVVLHLITTPLMYISALAVLNSILPSNVTGLFLASYGGVLIGTLPYKYGIPSIACLFLFSALVGWMRLCTR